MEIWPRETGDTGLSTERKKIALEKEKGTGTYLTCSFSCSWCAYNPADILSTPLHYSTTILCNHFHMTSTSFFTSFISLLLLQWPQQPVVLFFIQPWCNEVVLSPAQKPFCRHTKYLRHLQLLQLSEPIENMCFLNNLRPATKHTFLHALTHLRSDEIVWENKNR